MEEGFWVLIHQVVYNCFMSGLFNGTSLTSCGMSPTVDLDASNIPRLNKNKIKLRRRAVYVKWLDISNLEHFLCHSPSVGPTSSFRSWVQLSLLCRTGALDIKCLLLHGAFIIPLHGNMIRRILTACFFNIHCCLLIFLYFPTGALLRPNSWTEVWYIICGWCKVIHSGYFWGWAG